MLKKFNVIFALGLAIILTLTGCGVPAVNTAGGDTESAGATGSASGESDQKVIIGELSETTGNIVTLKIIERTQMPDGQMPENFANMTEEERQAMQDRRGQRPENGNAGGFSGDDGNGAFGPGGMNFDEMTEGMPIPGEGGFGRNYTGEELDIVIPENVTILETSFTSDGLGETEIKLEDLNVGDILTVTYASDGETVEKVARQVMGFRGDANTANTPG